jgi:transposase-like protein
VARRWRHLYRAVDQFGQIIDVLLAKKRDTAAARRCPNGRIGRSQRRLPRTVLVILPAES